MNIPFQTKWRSVKKGGNKWRWQRAKTFVTTSSTPQTMMQEAERRDGWTSWCERQREETDEHLVMWEAERGDRWTSRHHRAMRRNKSGRRVGGERWQWDSNGERTSEQEPVKVNRREDYKLLCHTEATWPSKSGEYPHKSKTKSVKILTFYLKREINSK